MKSPPVLIEFGADKGRKSPDESTEEETKGYAAMNQQTANILIVVGAGLLVFGLTGYQSSRVFSTSRSGWDTNHQLMMAIGATAVTAGWVFRRR